MSLIACSDQKGGENSRSSNAASADANDRIQELTDKILEKPNNPNLYVSRALAYSDVNMMGLALQDIDRALQIDSTVSYIHATKGELYFKTAELRNARLALEKAILYDPENIDALLKLGEVNYLLRRYPQAITVLDQALRLNERLPKAYFLKGFVFKESGDTSRALSSLQTAIEVNPDYYEAFMELALLHGSRGDEIALEYIETAIELRPSSVEAFYHLGLHYQNQGKYAEAIEAYNQLLKADPNGYLGYYNIGYIHLTEYEDFETALAYFDSVLTIQPGAVDALYNKGLCFEEMGRTTTAVDVYREVLMVDPQYTLAAMGLERLLE